MSISLPQSPKTPTSDSFDVIPSPPVELYPLESTEYYLQAAERLERTKSLKIQFPNLFTLPETPFTLYLHTMIRSHTTPRSEFIFYCESLFRQILEYSLEFCQYEPLSILTPTDNDFHGLNIAKEVVAVSIMRAGESLEHAAMDILGSVKIGKILVQRNDDHSTAQYFYSKLPPNVAECTVLLLDPMLASGSSAALAIQKLLDSGVDESDIVFVTLMCAPEGIKRILTKFPQLRIVTSMVDRELSDHNYILPGIGDLGDLYYGTHPQK